MYFIQNISIFTQGSFKNYVDKMRWVGGQKMLLFVQVQGKKCPRRGRQVDQKGQNLVHVVLNGPLMEIFFGDKKLTQFTNKFLIYFLYMNHENNYSILKFLIISVHVITNRGHLQTRFTREGGQVAKKIEFCQRLCRKKCQPRGALCFEL